MGFCVGLCFGMHNFMSFPVLHLVKEKRAGCFVLVCITLCPFQFCILLSKRELVALLLLSFRCLVTINGL